MKIIYKGESILNIPNLLSFYRLMIFPVIFLFAIYGNEKLFIIFICVSLITDVLDGFIARNFNMQTKFGLALDNLADVGTIFTAIYGMFVFRWEAFKDHAWLLYLFLFIFLLSYVIAFIRFKKIPGLHLYLSVGSAYLQSIFIFVLFAWKFLPWLYYLALIVGIIAYIEKSVILCKLDEIKAGIKGLYWMYKKDEAKN